MKRKSLFIVVVLGVIFILILVLPIRKNLGDAARTGASPATSIFSSLANKMVRMFSFTRGIASLRSQNRRLTEEIRKLEVDRSKIFELEHENTLLKKELGFFEEDKQETLVPARIVGREPVSFLDYVIIDKGRVEGIKERMAVVSGGVLIGQVTEVYDRRARVTLITSKDSIVQAMIQNSRSKGVLRGGISGLALENVAQDVEYSPGDYVVTSGLGEDLKEGILIGKAGGSRSPSSSIFKSITVEPIADFGELEIVFVVKG